MKPFFCTKKKKKNQFFADFDSNLATNGSSRLEASVGMIHSLHPCRLRRVDLHFPFVQKSYLSQFELAIEVDHLNNFKVMMIANLLL